MNSRTTKRFREMLAKLPSNIRQILSKLKDSLMILEQLDKKEQEHDSS